MLLCLTWLLFWTCFGNVDAGAWCGIIEVVEDCIGLLLMLVGLKENLPTLFDCWRDPYPQDAVWLVMLLLFVTCVVGNNPRKFVSGWNRGLLVGLSWAWAWPWLGCGSWLKAWDAIISKASRSSSVKVSLKSLNGSDSFMGSDILASPTRGLFLGTGEPPKFMLPGLRFDWWRMHGFVILWPAEALLLYKAGRLFGTGPEKSGLTDMFYLPHNIHDLRPVSIGFCMKTNSKKKTYMYMYERAVYWHQIWYSVWILFCSFLQTETI